MCGDLAQQGCCFLSKKLLIHLFAPQIIIKHNSNASLKIKNKKKVTEPLTHANKISYWPFGLTILEPKDKTSTICG